MAFSLADLSALSRLLDQAMEKDADQIDEWLASLPEEHGHFRQQLCEMLRDRLSQTSPDFLANGPRLSGQFDDSAVAWSGEQVGPYLLVREIGRGGMGTVWLAERNDGLLKRKIALKLPRLAWDANLSERMASERDIAALLEHPNIARLYDAGIDQRGRPYLALEYVDGQSVDAWCRTNAPTVTDRLRLFLQIARAVAYAHARLVVHRDLKSSNVLVTADGQAHLMDFGIAKLLTGNVASDDRLTREHGRMLSPHTASPEQLSGGTITVASDIYSLGALLYEVLTGTHPYVVKRNTAAAFEQAILDGEPVLASLRAPDAVTARQLRGDVDAILAKALQRAPAARYATVDAMAADIERHLNGSPVLAQPDRVGYRLAKTLGRHRLAFTAAGLVFVAVLGGAGLALHQAQHARAEAERARLVKEFVVDIFNTQAGPDGALGQMPAITLLERGAHKIDQKFADQPRLQAELYGAVSTMFYNLSNVDQAASYAKRQIATLQAVGAPSPQIARAMLWLSEIQDPSESTDHALARNRQALGSANGDAGIEVQAHAWMAAALMFGRADTARAALELDAAEASIHRGNVSASDRVVAIHMRGVWFAFRKLPEEARKCFDDTIALGLATEGPMSIHALWAREEAAKTLMFANRFKEGQTYLAAAVSMLKAAGGPDDVRAAIWEAYGANWMVGADDWSVQQELQTYERSLRTLRSQKWAVSRRDVASIERSMGLALIRWGDVQRGAALVQSGADDTENVSDPLSLWWRSLVLVRALTPIDRADDAAVIARQMLSLQDDRLNYDLRQNYKLLALALVHARRYADAESALAEFDSKVDASQSTETDGRASISLNETRLLVALEQGHAEGVVEMTSHLLRSESTHHSEVAWLSRATALCQTGAVDEGLALFEEWLPRLATDRYEASPHVAHWRARMGLCALKAGQRGKAMKALRAARAAITVQPGVSAHYRAPIDELGMRLRRG